MIYWRFLANSHYITPKGWHPKEKTKIFWYNRKSFSYIAKLKGILFERKGSFSKWSEILPVYSPIIFNLN